MRWIFFLLVFFSQSFQQIYGQEYVYPFIENGKIGFKNSRDSILIEPIYDFYEPFQKGYEWTVIGNGIYERLNNSATERKVKFSGKFGFMSASGSEILKPQFDVVLFVYENYAIVGKGEAHLIYNNWPEDKDILFSGKMGVFKRNGSLILPFEYKEIKQVVAPGQFYWFALDEVGRSLLYRDSVQLNFPEDVSDIHDFSDGRAQIRVDQKYGFIDESGTVVIEPVYDRARDFSDGRSFVKSGEKYGWIATSGEEIHKDSSIFFDEVGMFSEGYARVRIFDEYGFIRPDSSFFIVPGFTKASPFFNQIASVETIDSFGYVHTDSGEDIVSKYDKNRIDISPEPGIRSKIPDYDTPIIHWRDSGYFFQTIDTLTLEGLVNFQAEAMRWAPFLYFNYPQMLAKVSAGEGILGGRFLFNVSFLEPGNEIWETFKHKVLLVWLSDDKIRSILWKFARPVYKSSFQSMPELHRQVYRDMIDYLEDYYRNYDLEATREFLERNEPFFAHEHPDGSTSPYRKASAQIDRLILIYKIITVADVQKWIRKVKKEVSKW